VSSFVRWLYRQYTTVVVRNCHGIAQIAAGSGRAPRRWPPGSPAVRLSAGQLGEYQTRGVLDQTPLACFEHDRRISQHMTRRRFAGRFTDPLDSGGARDLASPGRGTKPNLAESRQLLRPAASSIILAFVRISAAAPPHPRPAVVADVSEKEFPVYEQLARIGKSVSSPHRIEILDLLAQGEKSVEALSAEVGLTVKNTSAHLRVLRGARLVESRKEAQYSFYRLADDAVASFVVTLRDLAHRRLAEVREFSAEFLGGRERLTPVDRRKLLKRIRSGEVLVLDVRAPEEYAAGHIPGARSVPLAELEKVLETIPRDREIVAYCRGPYCGLAEKAVALLRREGYRATRIPDSIVEWKDSGLPVVRMSSRRR
jgi:rhodanese-related sulfurtransferase/DNA-binding transcriptional ArsR family regulator